MIDRDEELEALSSEFVHVRQQRLGVTMGKIKLRNGESIALASDGADSA